MCMTTKYICYNCGELTEVRVDVDATILVNPDNGTNIFALKSPKLEDIHNWHIAETVCCNAIVDDLSELTTTDHENWEEYQREVLLLYLQNTK